MVAYSQANVGGAAQHAAGSWRPVHGRSHRRACWQKWPEPNVGVGCVRVVAKRLDLGVNHRNFIGHLARQALVIQSLHGLSVRHVGGVLAGEGELRQTQRVRAEGRSLARGDQLVGGGDGVGDVADAILHQQVRRTGRACSGQSVMLGPNFSSYVRHPGWPKPL